MELLRDLRSCSSDKKISLDIFNFAIQGECLTTMISMVAKVDITKDMPPLYDIAMETYDWRCEFVEIWVLGGCSSFERISSMNSSTETCLVMEELTACDDHSLSIISLLLKSGAVSNRMLYSIVREASDLPIPDNIDEKQRRDTGLKIHYCDIVQ